MQNYLKPYCCILTFDPAKHAIPKTVEVHVPLAWVSWADSMGQGWSSAVQPQTDAPKESDLWTAWQLFPLGDNQTCHSKDSGSDTSWWPVMGRYWVDDWTIIWLGEDRKSVSWRQDVVGKATTQQKGPSGPPIELEIRRFGDEMW